MKLTFTNRLKLCVEILTIRSGHKHTAQEKQLTTFMRGYYAGYKDGIADQIELQEPIRTQQAEIERLKGQRDRLLGALKDSNSRLCPFDEKVKIYLNSELIAEIEAEK